MIYSLIPAKVKSSRLEGKNTFKFMLKDKPLIAYTIEEVLKNNLIPHVFTNEKNIVNRYGSKIINRPEEISGLKNTMKETVKQFIDIMNINCEDTILLTYLTCPFRDAIDINEAINTFIKTGANSLQSLTAIDYRPYGLMKQSETNKHKFYCLQEQKDYYQKQNTPTLYKANGAIYIFKVSELDNLNNQMFNTETIGFVLDEIHGLDIDTKYDFMTAEKIMEMKNARITYQLSDSRAVGSEYNTNWTGTNI